MSDASNHVPDRVVALLKTVHPFDRLPPELQAELIADLLVEYFEPDEQILAQGSTGQEFLYIVESGCVRLADNTTHRLVDLCGEGDTFGSVGLLTDNPLPYEAATTEPTICALLRAKRFHALCEADAQFADFFRASLDSPTRAIEPGLNTVQAQLQMGARVGELIRGRPLTCAPDTTVRDAARLMRSEQLTPIVIHQDGRAIGILTDADFRNKIVAEGGSPDTPVRDLMSAPVVGVGANALVFDALMEMAKRRIRHLIVTETPDPASPLIGVLSDNDIAHANELNPAATVRRIEKARSVTDLAHIRTEADGHLVRLYRQGMQAEDLAEIVTEINDRLTLRLLVLAEAKLQAEPQAEPPKLRWTWLVFGSQGRREMGLRGDQDNALLYEDPPSPAEEERAQQWFGAIAKEVNRGLVECGFPACDGEVMAQNPKWCQPLSSWKRIFRNWVLDAEPDALLQASIFFDLRALYGETSLVAELKDDLCEALKDERGFLAFLAHNTLNIRPPLSFFRRFVVDHSGEYRNTFDLKLHGLVPLVDLARVLALDGHFLTTTHTLDRLKHAGERFPDAAELAANAIDAFRYLLDMRLGHHLRLLEAGEGPNDHIDPEGMSKTQQNMLRAVFSAVEDMQKTLAHRYGVHMMQR